MPACKIKIFRDNGITEFTLQKDFRPFYFNIFASFFSKTNISYIIQSFLILHKDGLVDLNKQSNNKHNLLYFLLAVPSDVNILSDSFINFNLTTLDVFGFSPLDVFAFSAKNNKEKRKEMLAFIVKYHSAHESDLSLMPILNYLGHAYDKSELIEYYLFCKQYCKSDNFPKTMRDFAIKIKHCYSETEILQFEEQLQKLEVSYEPRL